MSKVGALRAVTHRLNNTPVKELPHIAGFLASSILDCADTLKSTSGLSAGRVDDLSLQAHKLKARLASLLQDRSAEGRFTAIILVKATIEAGGREILGLCEPWLRGLLAILNRPDPVSSKRLCLLTITRIFSLTQQYPTLIREVTTPLLPAFVTVCLNLGGLHPSRSDEAPSTRSIPYLETVLQCMLHLIPDHPSTFRPFASKLYPVLANHLSGQFTSDGITRLVHSVFVTLHFCAPKNTAHEQWFKAYQAVVSSLHGVADEVLRAVVEDWESSDSARRQGSVRKTFDRLPHSKENDPLGVPPWEGVYQGSRVLLSLLRLLKTFLLSQTSQVVSLPLGLTLDLTSRLLHLRVPANSKESQTNVRFNPEIEREEREELLAILPEIHQSTLDLLSSLVQAIGSSIWPASHTIVEQCLWIFGSESSNESIRKATYNLFGILMPLTGPATTKDSFKPLAAIAEQCCKDILSGSSDSEPLDQSKVGLNSKPLLNGHADSFLQPSSKRTTKSQPQISAIQTAALKFMCQLLEHVPAKAFPHSLRAQIDRTAILKDQKRALLASVLNPAPRTTGKFATPSIMPFLVRTSQDELETEGLLRPRMPVIREAEASAYELETDSNAGVELEHSKDAVSSEGPDPEIPKQPIVHGLGSQNDILDRLGDSMQDGAATASNVEPQQTTVTSNQANIEPLPQQTNGSSHSNHAAKRNFDSTDNHEVEDTSSKRIRGSELDREANPGLKLAATSPSASASTPAMVVNPGPAMQVEVGAGGAAPDKGKARATSVSPRPEEGVNTMFENKNVDAEKEEDSDSDSAIPPLYLKTTDSENEEYDEDDDEDML
ncbi:hypothetical protein EPUS_05259 [Endocarpon pusillum Z07020]|uniref:Pre-rRNA-processing protein RIX1 n=1 Tax=Endocarpon pusillum (strain Z07020 / HMAS-L-300199) TaxID=1263415 RepID=U1G873_ENDPU|nr:uncharacterized protein EPUS_05259 [Endocarpon pusillum Z07020]ERF68178.1 hypothetical protein EPUS_05259 [Endocarpon pusillum Z07020]